MAQRKILKRLTIKVSPPEKKDPIEGPVCAVSLEPFERGVKGRRASAQFVIDSKSNATLEIKMSEESAAAIVNKPDAVSPITRGKIKEFPGGIKSISCDDLDRLIDRRNRKLIQKAQFAELLAIHQSALSNLITLSMELERGRVTLNEAKKEFTKLKQIQLPDQKTIAGSSSGPEVCSVSKRPFSPAVNERPVAVIVEDKHGPKLRIDLSEAEAVNLAAQPHSPLMKLTDYPFTLKVLPSTDLTNYYQEINSAVAEIDKIKAEIQSKQRSIKLFEKEIEEKLTALMTPVPTKVSSFGSTITVLARPKTLAAPKPKKRSVSQKTSTKKIVASKTRMGV